MNLRTRLLICIKFFGYIVLALALPIPYLDGLHVAQRFVLVAILYLLAEAMELLLSPFEEESQKDKPQTNQAKNPPSAS
jgi:hypothetical protein